MIENKLNNKGDSLQMWKILTFSVVLNVISYGEENQK